MEISNLYKEYGELMIKSEILNNQIIQVKTLIAEQLNKEKKEINK